VKKVHSQSNKMIEIIVSLYSLSDDETVIHATEYQTV